MTAPRKWTGKKEPSVRIFTPEMLAVLVEVLPDATSLRELALMFNVRLDVIRREVAPFLAIMKLTGTHPKCGCGRDRFHPYGCVDSYVKGDREGLLPGRTRDLSAALSQKREKAIDMIKAGKRWCEIDEACGISKGSARRYVRFMAPEDQAARQRLDDSRREQLRRAGARPGRRHRKPKPTSAPPPQPISDPLFVRISAAVPRWPSPALRQDIIGEIYLKVMEGTLPEGSIKLEAKRFASRAVADFENRFGPRSLDERVDADNPVPLRDLIRDTAAEDAFRALDGIRLGSSIRSPHRRSIEGRRLAA